MNIAIIAAAGQGKRMGDRRAKQFLELAGTPIIIHTLKRFDDCVDIDEMVVVLPAADLDEFRVLPGQFHLCKPIGFVPGGETRAESVRRGLESLQAGGGDIIAVHDGVRPFVTPQEISNTIRAAEKFGAAILVAPAIDTMKEIADNRIIRTLDRTQMRRALTPQCFRYELLRRAYEKANGRAKDATDCSFLVESLGEPVAVVEGHTRNIKITRPEDIIYGEILLRQESESSPES